ncbi:peptidoglycan synthetase FtsI [Moraxella macacae 0408225]|uniref:Peptidoglycan synthetase FtsI n=1 Tax=Moraxella macacae 0408225 TaxID=1230338 RepID=L2F8E9_9GAMM|nr:penicillin-binding protein 2 [Moraxella macacae]ELA09349.1 peptidoglycan synthetase FtsI [Moraxella macacae 0408225]
MLKYLNRDKKNLNKTPKKPKPKKGVGASMRGSVEEDSVRFKIVWVLMILCFGAVFCRVAYVQVINAKFYQEKGNTLITTTVKQPPYRGMIVDRNNIPLAISAPLVTLTFSPHDYAVEYYNLKAKEASLNKAKPSKSVNKAKARVEQRLKNMDLQKLATLTGIDVAQFHHALHLNHNIDFNDKEAVKAVLPTGAGSHYFMLMKNVNPERAQPIIDAEFVGVNIEHFYQRFYPQPQPNAQLLGFMSRSADKEQGHYRGQSGIEAIFENALAGSVGEMRVIKDAKNNRLKELEQIKPEVAGKDIKLTIDSRLQYILYQELERVGRVQKARWATGMIVDVNSGEVMAMSNWPSFNPNDLNSMTNENQRNHAVVDKFEPGSVMKPITVAIGLNSGQYDMNSKIDTNPGSMKLQGHTIRDHGNLGVIGLRQLLQKSSNIGSAKIALSLPPQVMSDGQKAFGFGKKTNLDFPGEVKGIVPTPDVKEISQRGTVAYGYGIDVTLAQLAQAYTILGSGGVFYPLTLVKSIRDNAMNSNNMNSVAIPFAKPKPYQVIKQSDALAIVDMMSSVTEEGGTAKLAAIDGYQVAGKTGTARRTNPKGGYYDNQYRTSFVGIAPASKPRFVVAIMVEDPQLQKFGGLVAAPVFRNVMKETLRLYNIPFDKPLTGKETTQVTLESVNDL